METASPKSNGMSVEEAQDFIQSADLSFLVDRLFYVYGWSRRAALHAVSQYRNFLFLQKKYGERFSLPPSYEIDEVWHSHILHTHQYVEFSEQLFGKFLHHQPGNQGDKAEVKGFQKQFLKTQALYRREFGDYLYGFKSQPLYPRAKKLGRKITGLYHGLLSKCKDFILPQAAQGEKA